MLNTLPKLIRRTPLLLTRNAVNNEICLSPNQNILYKLDNLQYLFSFKDRGISHMISTIHAKKPIAKLIR
jgi:threonine dehydratase